MVGFLAVLLPVLVVVGAFTWMQPSKRDQHLAKLRSQALVQGFRIDSLRIPDTSEFGRVNNKYQIVTIYQRSVVVERDDPVACVVLRTTGEQGIHLPEGWQWESRSDLTDTHYQALADLLPTIPASISVIRVAIDSVGVCWSEQEGSLVFSELKEHISSIADVFDKNIV